MMKFTLPESWVIPNADGSLPQVLAGFDATTTWLDIVDYWTSLGYFLVKGSGGFVQMELLGNPQIAPANEHMQLAWWLQLCDYELPQYGEVTDWQAVIQLHPTVYAQGEVPPGIPNREYGSEDPAAQAVRLWDQWGSPNHTHYYVADYNNGEIVDRYLVPTWSWGTNLLGTEMMSAQKESGTNIITRRTFNQIAAADAMVPVEIRPTA